MSAANNKSGTFSNPIMAMLGSKHVDAVTFVCDDPKDVLRARDAALTLRHRNHCPIRTTTIYPEGLTVYKAGEDKWELGLRQKVFIKNRTGEDDI